MIKNKMARLVGSAMAAALMFSAISPAIEVSAKEINTGEKTAATEEYNQQLAYAIEEIRVVVDYLDNKDLANPDNREYVLAFASAAVERVRGMESNEHITFINETAEQLRMAIDISDRLYGEMKNIKEAFDNDYSKEHKETVLGYLNGTLSDIVHSEYKNYINKTTLNNANKFLHKYADKLAAKDVKSSNIDQEQLKYAIEEMRIAIDIMDNKNLIDRDNYDRMVIFANTAVERIKDMDPENEYVKDIYRLAGEISTLDNTILRRVMTDVEGVQNATADTKEDWINALNESITYGRKNNLLNYETAFAATEILHTAAGIK
ncbi:hypothetical protein [Terrisporobacter glycolicus]|uniref:Uncharacterized protein n=1 Tax=Terrisporobacter glycolicus ATCC 14880 = DSM 1288 TaxID=1121315 RepID=A0ABZ2ERY6_9FIRM|nr:hypothetical protein [Terrisporobacter glycolicus]